MTITLCGENSFALQHALREIVADFAARHNGATAEYMSAEKVRPADLRTWLQSVGLFSSARLLVLTEPGSNKELLAELGDIAALPDGDTAFVIVGGVLDKRTKTYKTLQATTDFRDFPLLAEGELAKWVTRLTHDLGGDISPSAARTLVEYVGCDQWQLQQEVTKLVAYSSTVTNETIDLLVTPNLETSAFALLDAAMQGNTTQTKRLLGQLKSSSDPYEFFGLLAWQVHALALVAFAPSNMSSAEIARTSGLKPFVVQKTQSIARKFGPQKVTTTVASLAQLDTQLKSTGINPWLLIEQFLGKITAK